ncbi:hypothetical protein [Naasia sp. SYSU D00057]|uniref:hypothetical protein n=1 Tax=Naasia sp. SYSU D00057 TaxID=2817380 RepID=UPI001B30CDD4|nr:hypothetical protein [Naasia sp. SYSU D00057]
MFTRSTPGAVGARNTRLAAIAAAVAAVAGFAVLTPVQSASAAPLGSTSTVRLTDLGSDATADLQYVGNQSIGNNAAGNPNVRTVVLVVHGDGRDAAGYADSTLKAAVSAGKVGTTAVIAPHFLSEADGHSGRMYWTDGGWKIGDPSLDSSRLSSFDVLDRLIARVQDGRFPNLDRLVVAGHSAGGQFVQRFAAGSDAAGVDEYVVANPSSYLFLSSARWSGSRLRELTSSEKSACRDYNDYKHGLNARNAYMDRVPADALKARYASHPVTYLLGTSDTSRVDNLDTSCAADWQGKNRLERGRNFFSYEKSVWGSTPSGHRKVEVPNIGHSWAGMVKSSQGTQALFG